MPDGTEAPAPAPQESTPAPQQTQDTNLPNAQPQEGQQESTPAPQESQNPFAFTDADWEQKEDADATNGQDGDNGQQEGEQAQDAPAEGFVLDAERGIPEGYHEGLGKLAAKHNINGKAAAALLQDALDFANEQERQANVLEGQKLQEEWGNQFEAKVKANIAFMVKLAKDANIPRESMSIFESPHGQRLADAIRAYCGDSGKLAGDINNVPRSLSPQEQVDAIYQNPQDYEALINPSNPRYNEVHARVNSLLGITAT